MSANLALETLSSTETRTQVLLVEDDRAFAYVLRRMVEDESPGVFAVETAERLAEALEHLRDKSYSCILLDLQLPDSRDLSTFRRVARLAYDVPIVVLSGNDDSDIAVQAVREGAQDYLVKGSVDGFLLVRSIRYAIERHHTQKIWRRLSLRDDLTGLYNRRGFLALGGQQLKLARRRGHSHLVLFIDLDDLKQINDGEGHETGNEAIREAAAVLRQTFRETDVIARVGGDEFVVLLEGIDQDRFRVLAERLEERLGAANRRLSTFRLSMSWGTAEFDPDRPRALEELLREADLAMYEVKRRKKEEIQRKHPALSSRKGRGEKLVGNPG